MLLYNKIDCFTLFSLLNKGKVLIIHFMSKYREKWSFLDLTDLTVFPVPKGQVLILTSIGLCVALCYFMLFSLFRRGKACLFIL